MKAPRVVPATALRSDAERLSLFPNFGIPPFKQIVTSSYSIAAGTRQTQSAYLEANESIQIALPTVSGGTNNAIDFVVFTDAQYQLWSQNQSATYLIQVIGATSGTLRTLVAPADGYYWIVLQNSNANISSRSVTLVRDSTYFDAAYDIAQAIFLAVRAKGVTYSSINASAIIGVQNIRTPANVLANRAGNCIEGSLLFASVAEQVGFEPFLHVFTQCSDGLGHAIFAVRVPGAKYFWPIETTQVGTLTVSPSQAVQIAIATVNGHTACNYGASVSLARAHGITPGQ